MSDKTENRSVAAGPLQTVVGRREAIHRARLHNPVIANSMRASEIGGDDWTATVEKALLNLLDAHNDTVAAFIRYAEENPRSSHVVPLNTKVQAGAPAEMLI